jgi:hypothetical protein
MSETDEEFISKLQDANRTLDKENWELRKSLRDLKRDNNLMLGKRDQFFPSKEVYDRAVSSGGCYHCVGEFLKSGSPFVYSTGIITLPKNHTKEITFKLGRTADFYIDYIEASTDQVSFSIKDSSNDRPWFSNPITLRNRLDFSTTSKFLPRTVTVTFEITNLTSDLIRCDIKLVGYLVYVMKYVQGYKDEY